MKRGDQIRRHDLRRYLIYRIKLMEWMQLFLMWIGCGDGSVKPLNMLGQRGEDFQETLRTVLLSWLSTIVDTHKDGLNVFDLWHRLYPKHQERIRRVRAEVEPQLKLLRDFRDRVGFHADTPEKYFGAKYALITNDKEIIRSQQAFHDLTTFLLRRETEELPDFVPAVEELLLDIESLHKVNINREWFKKMLILPRENYRRVF